MANLRDVTSKLTFEQARVLSGMAGKAIILDAPTGAGKTWIGTAWAAQQKDPRLTYSCSTRQLQEQYVRDFPEAVTIKGRANYPTQRYPDEWPYLSCDNCTMREMAECDLCEEPEECPYPVQVAKAKKARHVCTNHAYLLTARFPVKGSLIMDEADELERMALDWSAFDVSMKRLREACPGTDVTPHGMPVSKPSDQSWLHWLRQLPHKMAGGNEELVEDALMTAATLEQSIQLHGFMETDKRWVVDGYKGRGNARTWQRVKIMPVVPPNAGRETQSIFEDYPVLFMSASILSKDMFCYEIGLDPSSTQYVRAFELGVATPFNSPIFYVPVADVSGSRKAAIQDGRPGADGVEQAGMQMAKVVAKLAWRYKPDAMLVHTVSYKLGTAIGERLKHSTPTSLPVIMLKRGRQQEAVEKFEEQGGILVGPGLERGYDGRHVDMNVIAKLPWPYLDKRAQARVYGLRDSHWYQTQMARRLVQMTGRGVRGKDDFCINVVLDEGFAGASRRLGDTLPESWKERVKWQSRLRREVLV